MEMMLRASMPDEEKYLPYSLCREDGWTPGETKYIDARMKRTHPHTVTPTYNTWCFSRYQYGQEEPRYYVRRSTWETSQWSSSSLNELLDATDIAGAKWTVSLLGELLPDAILITPDQAIAMPFAWYADEPAYQHNYYHTMRAIWLLERPHVTALLHTYQDPSNPNSEVWREQMKFHPAS